MAMHLQSTPQRATAAALGVGALAGGWYLLRQARRAVTSFRTSLVADDQISRFFSLHELMVSDTAARRGLVNVPGRAERERLAALATNVLDPLRAWLGVPIQVTSAFRSEAVNRAVGGSKTSQHRLGEAADIKVAGMSSQQLASKIMEAAQLGIIPGYDQLIHYGHKGHVHVSWSSSRPQRRLVSYSPSPKTYRHGVAPWAIA